MGKMGQKKGNGWPLVDVKEWPMVVVDLLEECLAKLQKIEEKMAMLEGRLAERVEGGDGGAR